ncbi:hypothetical protein L1987_74622 [Smallanthus sonchifolius]|uniref:Uncharacterized protein n=1 Tax=Smallanthus sonchifolius TaxID=185202 RepID=A0ACB9A4S6_9ASTR|nr:hypothetical protein L1987_74622 [Smallanthus sonchifolius]
MCNGCAPQDTTLVPNSQETLHDSTSTPTPVASVPQTLVENNQLVVVECLHESQPSSALESNGSKSPIKAQAPVQARNEKLRGEKSGKHDQYRYTPRMTDEEIKEIYKGSNVSVTPLFEKMLTASDTGKSGRLVLPKKCAEKFFPSIDDAQYHPIEIQDSEGKDWNFRLRMSPNNNSKMYLLEGFEPNVKSMKLAEGDTVTFSRLVPEGKLVSKGKRTSTTRKPNVVTAKGSVGSKRKTCEIGLNKNKRLEVVKRAPELVDSPRRSNVLSNVVEKGFERRTNKIWSMWSHYRYCHLNGSRSTPVIDLHARVQFASKLLVDPSTNHCANHQVVTQELQTETAKRLPASALRTIKT